MSRRSPEPLAWPWVDPHATKSLCAGSTIIFISAVIALGIFTDRFPVRFDFPLDRFVFGHRRLASATRLEIARPRSTVMTVSQAVFEYGWFHHLSSSDAVHFADQHTENFATGVSGLNNTSTSSASFGQLPQRPWTTSTSGKLLWPILLQSNMADIGMAAARPHGYRGDLSRVRAGFARAVKQGTLVITVLGGSMPLGSDLKSRLDDRWSTKLKQALRWMGWVGNLTIHNLAVGGLPSYTQTPNIVEQKNYVVASHLVIVDIAINDRLGLARMVNHSDDPGFCQQVEGCELMDALLQLCGNDTGVVYFETFPRQAYNTGMRTAAQFKTVRATTGLALACVQAGNISFKLDTVRVVDNHRLSDEHGLVPRGVYWNTPYDNDEENSSEWVLHENPVAGVAWYYHWPRLIERKIPVISYGDGAAVAATATNGQLLWSDFPHPDAETHFLAGIIVAHALRDMIMGDNSPRGTVAGNQELEWDQLMAASPLPQQSADARCFMNPVTLMNAAKAKRSHFLSTSRGDAWKFYEDVKGKPGWIAQNTNTSAGRSITFTITIGPLRRVHMSYLRTYGAGLGYVRCSVGCAPNVTGCPYVELITERARHISQAAIELLTPTHAADSYWQVGARALLRCDASPGKSKLLGIYSC